MNASEFNDLLSNIQSEELEVCKNGQAEYAHNNNNVFANFDRVANHLGISREQALLTYALKHLDGIVSYVKGHKSQREDVRGRIKDLRMYLALLWGMIEESDPIPDGMSRAREEERLLDQESVVTDPKW